MQRDTDADENSALRALHNGEPYDFASLRDQFDLIKRRGDTADFRLQSLTRIVYDHANSISSKDFQCIKQARRLRLSVATAPGNGPLLHLFQAL